jgi:hypothetical protein
MHHRPPGVYVIHVRSKWLCSQPPFEHAPFEHAPALYHHWKIPPSSYTLRQGDTLRYEVLWEGEEPAFIGLDFVTHLGTRLRDSKAVDQHGLSAHPGEDIGLYAKHQWFQRSISIPESLVGHRVNFVLFGCERIIPGQSDASLRNIRVTDSNNHGRWTVLASKGIRQAG